MNLWLQIGLGLMPGTVVTVILLFKRKAFQLKKILVTAALLLACAGSVGVGIASTVSTKAEQAGLSRKKTISFANALMLEGAYTEAYEVIEEYSEKYGYDEECRVLTARINLLQGDYDRAQGIYAYLSQNTDMVSAEDDEVAYASACALSGRADLNTMQYLKSIGAKLEEYGYSEDAYQELLAKAMPDAEDIKKAVKKAVKDSIDDEMAECAEAVHKVSVFNAGSGEDGEKSAKKLKKAFEQMAEESPEFLSVECVKKARIKAYVLNGDYEEIVQGLGQNASYHELMIAAELYMCDRVKTSDFPKAYLTVQNEDAREIEKRIDKIYQELSEDLSKTERKNLKGRVNAIYNQIDDSVLVTIKDELTTLNEEKTGTDKTKVSLELAKIEDYFGNETGADGYLSEAVYSSQDCKDDSYVAAMSQIIGVISNDDEDDSEDIKNVSEYVNAVLDHSLTVDVEKLITPKKNPNETEEDGETEKTFAQTAVDYVSRIKSAIAIGRIDTENFPHIEARVQISSDSITDIDELKAALKIYDCNAEIQDFDLGKIKYTGSNIMLVCDVSGSMSDGIGDLRESVKAFVNSRGSEEQVSVVTFSSSIQSTKPFGTSDADLLAFAEDMYATGGTNVYGTVLSCLDDFPEGGDNNNVLIVMTDGQDGNAKDKETIYTELGAKALEKGVTIYTLGLGSSVDTAYLSTIAGSGNGKFIYVSDSSSLTGFYDMLHAQVSNQYKLTYTAADTITMAGRTLEVTLPSENLRDTKTYHLGDEENEEDGLTASKNLSVSGLSPRYVYKGLQDVTVKLKGTGFKEEDVVNVKLNGHIDYTLEPKFLDAENYELTIPASIAVGNYNVEVTINGNKKILQNGLSVITQGSETKTAFGPYVFTSSEKIEQNGNVILRGNVTMNGWLHFKGDLTLTGDLEEGGSVQVYDGSGSYVEFDTATAVGIGKFLAGKGINLDVPALYGFTLYNDQQHFYDYENYMVDDILTGTFGISRLVNLYSPVVRLYPDSIGVYFSGGTTVLPYQDQILDAANIDLDLFDFNYSGSAKITNQNVGLVIAASYGEDEDEYGHTVNILNAPVYFNGGLDVSIDTIKNEYSVGGEVGLAFFAKSSRIGAEVAWAGNLVPDSVELKLNLKKPVKLPTTFPIEVNNFAFKVSGINDAVETGKYLGLLYTGKATFTSANLEYYFPGISKVVGDISVLEMPDTEASVRLWPIMLEAKATLNFLSEIKLAEAGVRLGVFEYTNPLLQMNAEEVAGLSASVTQGIMWQSDDGKVDLNISGTGQLDAHTRFIGTTMKGTAKFNFAWWLFELDHEATGDCAMGFYTTHDGRQEFIFTYRTQESNGKVKGKFYYIDENGHCGKESGTLS